MILIEQFAFSVEFYGKASRQSMFRNKLSVRLFIIQIKMLMNLLWSNNTKAVLFIFVYYAHTLLPSIHILLISYSQFFHPAFKIIKKLYFINIIQDSLNYLL